MKKHKLYPLWTKIHYEKIVTGLKRNGYKKPAKSLIEKSCFDLPSFMLEHSNYFSHIFPSEPADITIYTQEFIWSISGRKVIYPRSVDEMNVLGKSSFRNLDITNLSSDSLIIASPPESKFSPILVGYSDRKAVLSAFEQLKKQGIDTDPTSTNGVFSVIFPDQNSSYMLTLEIADYDIAKYAEARTTEAIYDLIQKTRTVEKWIRPSKEEMLEQARILKTALNLWLYQIANPKRFIHQTPPAHARKTYGSQPTKSYGLDLSKKMALKTDGKLTEVGIHMRNLKHEKYYRSPEWIDMPIGSRWTEVTAYTKGGIGYMHTDGIPVEGG